MKLKRFRFILFFLIALFATAIEFSFSPPQQAKITVRGRANFDYSSYPNKQAKVFITEDGKEYQTVYSDDRGNFEAQVGLNHNYMFHLSMDYHGTSKVQINTKVPDIVAEEMTGALIEFKCPMYRLYKGVNMGILNKPLIKLKFNPKKDKFEFDEDYARDMRYDVEGFLSQIDAKEAQKAPVLKNEPQKQKSNVSAKQEISKKEDKKERKVIEFEVEKKKVAENKRGHRNIMEPEKMEVEQTEPIDTSDHIAVAEEVQEVIEEEEEIDFVSLNVVPKRILIDDSKSKEEGDESDLSAIELEKSKMREAQEIARLDEEAKIRDEVRSLNRRIFEIREKTMSNKTIQTERLRGLIETISLAKIEQKKEYYSQNPIDHNNILPSVVIRNNDGWWIDEEKVVVRYPDVNQTFRKEIYPFGITYYYLGEEEISADAYCSKLEEVSKNYYSCTN